MFEELIRLKNNLEKCKSANCMEMYEKLSNYFLNLGRIYYNSESLSFHMLNKLLDQRLECYPNFPIEFAPMLINKIDYDSKSFPYFYVPAQAYVGKVIRQNHIDDSVEDYCEVSFIYKTLGTEQIDLIDWFSDYDDNVVSSLKSYVQVPVSDRDLGVIKSWCDKKNEEMMKDSKNLTCYLSMEEEKRRYLEKRNQLVKKMIYLQNSIPMGSSLGLKLKKNNTFVK